MSSSVCQGLQSCLEPRLVEPLVLRLKLAPPKSKLPCDYPSNHHSINPHSEENNTTAAVIAPATTTGTISRGNSKKGCWSLLEKTLFNDNNEEMDNKVYVHPLVKHSSSQLSQKSLEMCTESLGSETGSDVSENSDVDMSLWLFETTRSSSCKKKSSKLNGIWASKKAKWSVNFPPPLTSISGSNGFKVKPHREGGRLVLKAVAATAASSSGYFHAERGDGRLRLRLLKGCYENQVVDNEEEVGDEESEFDEVYDDNDDDEEEESGGGNGVGIEKNGNVGGESGMEKFSRPSRCKQSNCGSKGLVNWESFWVAT